MSHALREAVAAFHRAPVLTGLSAAMVGLALFVVALFALAAYNLRIALQSVEERVEAPGWFSGLRWAGARCRHPHRAT